MADIRAQLIGNEQTFEEIEEKRQRVDLRRPTTRQIPLPSMRAPSCDVQQRSQATLTKNMSFDRFEIDESLRCVDRLIAQRIQRMEPVGGQLPAVVVRPEVCLLQSEMLLLLLAESSDSSN